YTGAYLMIALVITHIIQHRSLREMLRSLTHPSVYLSIGISVIVFFVLNPYILLSPQEFWKDFSYEQYHMSTGHLGLNVSQNTFSFYMVDVLPSVMGWLLLLAMIFRGMSYCIGRNKQAIIILLFPAITLFIIGMWEMRADRYVLPLLPMMIIIGSDGLMWGWNFLRSSLQRMYDGIIIRYIFPTVIL